MDHGFTQVQSIPVPNAEWFRGAVASAATGALYVSYGSFGGPGGQLSQLSLATNQIAWTQTYDFGIDSMSITPDGRTLYMPTGWSSPGGLWEILDAGSGNPEGSINTTGTGPHNTIVSLDGTRVAMGPGYSDYLFVADTATNTLLASVGPVASGVRPFTINGLATTVFMTTTGYLGFYVGDMSTGEILFTVPVPGFTSSAPSTCHGISLSPDETELYLIDYGNNYVHVFDPTGLPGSAPTDVADIKLQTPMTDEGWLQHTRDGRYVVVGDCGDVIDTASRTVVGNLPALQGTRIFTEIDFQNGVVSFAPQSRNQGGYVTQIGCGL
jgi:DNA-binding beta-propeller fold protein YncE